MSRYPHRDHPGGEKGKKLVVCFLGSQTLIEQGKDPIQTSDVSYTFASPEVNGVLDGNKFRELVWGKKLVLSIEVKEVTWLFVEANRVSLALWNSRSTEADLTVLFRARMSNGTLEQVELQRNATFANHMIG
ncbi:hypothetical protein MMC21_003748 [Puttea exsequens]|nr:hypothetical protein [Puttea exsequens]